uniref:Uncharacterized protein n=1 Tax=Panagrolaimus sp. ES5 TaxID=591445 RepID=A0AC34FGL4_9BILA
MAADGLLGKKRARPRENAENKSEGEITADDEEVEDEDFDDDDVESGGSNTRVLPNNRSRQADTVASTATTTTAIEHHVPLVDEGTQTPINPSVSTPMV